MTHTAGTFTSPVDGTKLATYAWGAHIKEPRGVVQIAHGIAEHSGRYTRLADALVNAGYRVHANDHRGHGLSISDGGVPGDFGNAGFEGVGTDIAAYGASVRSEGLKLFLIAHSMGSFATQAMLPDYSDDYDGVVLSGTTALDVLAESLAALDGDDPIGLEAFNAAFENRTGYEWLSRDPAEVDKYVADPLSGFGLPDNALPQVLSVAGRAVDPTVLGRIRSGLPVLLVSGEKDPVAGDGQLVQLVGQRYRDAGLTDVTVTIYHDARHEIFNETNRDEITRDVVGWIRAHS